MSAHNAHKIHKHNSMLCYPLSFSVYFFLFFIAGVAAAFAIKNVDYVIQILIATICITIIAIPIILIRQNTLILIFTLSLAAFTLGYAYTALKYCYTFQYPLEQHSESIDTMKGFKAKVVSYEGLRRNKHEYIVNVDELYDGTNSHHYNSKIRFYHYGDNMLGINDYITSTAKIKLYETILTNEDQDNEAMISMLGYKSLVGVATSYNYRNIVVIREGFSIVNYLNKHLLPIRTFIKKSLGENMTSLNYSVAQCLLIGDKNVLPYPLREEFQKVGISHILSVSGLHVSIIYSILFILLRPIPIHKNLKLLIISMIVLVFYLPLTLYSIPILRSAIMITIVAIAIVFDRTRNILNILLMTAFIIILENPSVIKEISFQLSFLATFSLIIYMPMIVKLIKPLHDILKIIISFFAVSILANVILLPLVSTYFGTIVLTSIIANIYALPLTFAIIILNIVIIICYKICPPIASMVGSLNNTLVDMLIVYSRWLGDKDIWHWQYRMEFNNAVILTVVMIIASLIFSYLFHKKSFNDLMK